MMQAYILRNVEGGSGDDMLKEVKSMAGVERSYVSYGVYDLIIKIKANSIQELKDVVIHRIRQIKTAQSTLTLMILEE
jgi:DNA-binding Lrp family transcriptional regulator